MTYSVNYPNNQNYHHPNRYQNQYSGVTMTKTLENGSMVYTRNFSSYTSSIVRPEKMIDLTNISTIEVSVDVIMPDGGIVRVQATKADGYTPVADYTIANSIKGTKSGTFMLDVSALSGKYYIDLPVYTWAAATITLKVHSVKLV